MGFSIGIGEYVKEGNDWYVQHITHPGAPVFVGDGEEPQSNYRRIDTLSWQDFLRENQLSSFDYYGRRIITPGLLDLLENRKMIRYAKVGLPAGFLGEPGPCVDGIGLLGEHTHDWHLARLEWAIWWCHWAKQNCIRPTL